MNKNFAFLIIFLPTLCFGLNKPDLAYSLKRGKGRCVEVTAILNSSSQSETVIRIPWSPILLHGKKIKFTFDDDRVEILEVASRIKLPVLSKSKVTAEYTICEPYFNDYRLGVMASSYLYLTPVNFAIFLEAQNEKDVTIELNLEDIGDEFGVLSDYFGTMNSHIVQNLEKFLFSQILLVPKNYVDDNSQGTSVYPLASWDSYPLSIFNDNLQKLMKYQRDYMDDYDFKKYSFIFLKKDIPELPKQISGSHSYKILSFSFPEGPESKRYKINYGLY